MAAGVRTIDHDEIREWAEARGGKPAAADWDGASGVLRIDFNEPDASLTPISWDDFFRVFDERNLAFLYQEETDDGNESRFFKLVERDG